VERAEDEGRDSGRSGAEARLMPKASRDYGQDFGGCRVTEVGMITAEYYCGKFVGLLI
jgi:hypothetical protein